MPDHLVAQWHPTKNGDVTPDMVTDGSNAKVWWVCEHGHEWQAVVANRTKGSGCPVCFRRRCRTTGA
ncbi:zinc-ribbon domain-containing protein [Lawsonella clevelandensis]|uniref:zinc-ribbon domain-containing protein n=1 Tax=Lawsonella clevelandensis TaxID=1528099 RepID=UPI0036F1CFE2